MKKILILSAIVLSVFAVSAIAQTNTVPAGTNAPVVTHNVESDAIQLVSDIAPNVGWKNLAALILSVNLLAQGINNYYLKRNPKAQNSTLGKLVAHVAVDPITVPANKV